MHTDTEEAWRFHVNEHDGTITRGRKYRLPGDWTHDSWQHYWDGDLMVAVYDHRDYSSPTPGEDTERAERVVWMCREYDQDLETALTRLARRLTGEWNAGFVAVNIDRRATLYAMTWDASDTERNREWADEIEAVNHGDIWRIECEENVSLIGDEYEWHPAEEVYEDFYGEDQAQAGLEREFPLAELPASALVTGEN